MIEMNLGNLLVQHSRPCHHNTTNMAVACPPAAAFAPSHDHLLNDSLPPPPPPHTSTKCQTAFLPRWSSFNPSYKTRLCQNHQQLGFCAYGDKCTFAHGVEDLRIPAPTNLIPTGCENHLKRPRAQPRGCTIAHIDESAAKRARKDPRLCDTCRMRTTACVCLKPVIPSPDAIERILGHTPNASVSLVQRIVRQCLPLVASVGSGPKTGELPQSWRALSEIDRLHMVMAGCMYGGAAVQGASDLSTEPSRTCVVVDTCSLMTGLELVKELKANPAVYISLAESVFIELDGLKSDSQQARTAIRVVNEWIEARDPDLILQTRADNCKRVVQSNDGSTTHDHRIINWALHVAGKGVTVGISHVVLLSNDINMRNIAACHLIDARSNEHVQTMYNKINVFTSTADDVASCWS